MNHESMVKELQEILPEIPKPDLPVLLGELERLKALTWHRMMSETYTPQSGAAQTLLTMKDVASQLNIPLSCAYDLARQGKLLSIRVGVNDKYVRVRVEDLEKYKSRI